MTRGLTLRLAARAGVAGRASGPAARRAVADVAELFLTGTTSEVLPVVRVDGRPVGDGRPGPVTRRLQEAYGAAVRAFRGGGAG